MTYDLIPTPSGSQVIQRTDDDGSVHSIPTDERNSDYQAYLAYLAKNPWTPEQLSAQQAALTQMQTAQANAQAVVTTQVTTLASLVGSLSAQVTQAQADLATLAASTDPLAPILTRAIEAVLALTQGLASIGVLGGHVDPTKVPKI